MRDVSTLKPIGSAQCPQYNTEAKFYIDAAHKSGKRHLVVHYEKGGHNGAPEFVAGIPDDWSEENVIDLILRPLERSRRRLTREVSTQSSISSRNRSTRSTRDGENREPHNDRRHPGSGLDVCL